MSANALLRTRLRPPRLPAGALERASLLERALHGIERGRLSVVAGAGYGKSTLLAQVVERSPYPSVWCSCDARMTETSALLLHISAGFGEVVPGFGASLRPQGTTAEQVTALCNEVDLTVADPVVLVLDDVHTLIDRPAAEAVAQLIDDLPDVVRLIVCGRSLPPLPLPRLRVRGLEEIGSADLALDPAQVRLITASFGAEIDQAEASALHAATEGWVAGVLLAGQGRRTQVADIDREGMFDYLATEVLAAEPSETLEVMEAAAVLSRFTPELVREVSGVADAEATVLDLAARQLFTSRLEGEDWYRFHHLLRDHLLGRLREGDPERELGLHARAGHAWAKIGEPLEAARHFTKAGTPEIAAQVLEPHAETISAGPDGPALSELLDSMPPSAWVDRPPLLTAQSTLQMHLGNHERGFDLAESAVAQLIDLADDDRAAEALTTHVMALAISGVPAEKRIAVAERYLARIGPCPTLPALQVMHAASLATGGRRADALALLQAGRAAAVRGGPPVDVFADVVEGFYIAANDGHPVRAIELLSQASRTLSDRPGPLALRFGLFAAGVRVHVLVNQGRWNEALDGAAELRGLIARHRLSSADRSSSWWRLAALAGLERWEDLADQLQPAVQAAGVSASHYGYRQRSLVAMLAAFQQDRAAVIAQCDAAIREMTAFGEAYDHPWVMSDLSTALLRVREPERAATIATRAIDVAVRHVLPWEEARASLRLSLCVEGPQSAAALERALALTNEYGFDDLWIRRERRDSAACLAHAIAEEIGPGDMALRLAIASGSEVTEEVVNILAPAPQAIRVRVAEALGDAGTGAEVVALLLADAAPSARTAARSARRRQGERPRASLHIRAFGGLSVERDGVPVPRSAFGRDKARQLLAALLSAGGPVHREVILDWLWPDLDVERAARAFHVTLHALRRTLEPDLAPRSPSSLVALEGDAYRIVLTAEDSFDVGQLLQLARGEPGESPSARLGRLERGAMLPAGEVFPEWPYAAWASEVRDSVTAARRAIRRELGMLLIEANRSSDAVPHLSALVDLEPEREEWHRLLMRAYAAAGEQALALRQFHACRARLRRELAIDVGPETRALYTRILKGEDLSTVAV